MSSSTENDESKKPDAEQQPADMRQTFRETLDALARFGRPAVAPVVALATDAAKPRRARAHAVQALTAMPEACKDAVLWKKAEGLCADEDWVVRAQGVRLASFSCLSASPWSRSMR
jgi:hypothetical protein